MSRTKIEVPVTAPVTKLELDAFASSEIHGLGRTYDLYAVVNHHGATVASGHYTAECKDPFSSNWLKFDDDIVTPVDRPQMKENYILFYA